MYRDGHVTLEKALTRVDDERGLSKWELFGRDDFCLTQTMTRTGRGAGGGNGAEWAGTDNESE